MKMNLKIDPPNKMLEKRGLDDQGKVQKYVDKKVLQLSETYIPARNLVLTKSGTTGTVIGSGLVQWVSPYARFQFYGKLMISPITGSPYARMGEKKILTNTPLKHIRLRHRKASAHWFNQMKADHGNEIISGAQKLAGGK